MSTSKITIRGEEFSKRHPLIIAEMANSHDGSHAVAKKIIKAAADAGVDAIKIQRILANEIAVPGYKYHKLLKKCEMEFSEWKKLVDYAKGAGLMVFADVFGIKSLADMEKLDLDAYEIHPSDITNPALIKAVAGTGKPTILYLGGTTIEEAEYAVWKAKEGGAKEILIMHGFQAFPTKVQDTNLDRIRLFHNEFNLPVGFADHIDGDDKMAVFFPLVALGMGAVAIEKHVCFDRSAKPTDYQSALNPDELKQHVECIRRAQTAFGPDPHLLNEAEIKYKRTVKKHILACTNIPKGHRITEKMLCFKRVDSPLPFLFLEQITGKTAARDIKKNDVVATEALA